MRLARTIREFANVWSAKGPAFTDQGQVASRPSQCICAVSTDAIAFQCATEAVNKCQNGQGKQIVNGL
jgi:hypothetical protein